MMPIFSGLSLAADSAPRAGAPRTVRAAAAMINALIANERRARSMFVRPLTRVLLFQLPPETIRHEGQQSDRDTQDHPEHPSLREKGARRAFLPQPLRAAEDLRFSQMRVD